MSQSTGEEGVFGPAEHASLDKQRFLDKHNSLDKQGVFRQTEVLTV